MPLDENLHQISQVVYEWARGTPFDEICTLTDVMEGSIVRAVVRLDQACRCVANQSRELYCISSLASVQGADGCCKGHGEHCSVPADADGFGGHQEGRGIRSQPVCRLTRAPTNRIPRRECQVEPRSDKGPLARRPASVAISYGLDGVDRVPRPDEGGLRMVDGRTLLA